MSRRLGMGWKQMQREMDSEEIAYQMAYDLIESAERKGGRPMAEPPSRVPRFDADRLLRRLDRFWPPEGE